MSEVFYMNMRQRLLAGATVMLLATSPTWAAGDGKACDPHPGDHNPSKCVQTIAPEMNPATGTSAIALLTGVLLLVGERSRSRRS